MRYNIKVIRAIEGKTVALAATSDKDGIAALTITFKDGSSISVSAPIAALFWRYNSASD